MKDFLDIATRYARAGIHVLPIAAGGKLPAISKADGGNGVYDATTDESTLIVWAAKYPNANIGVFPKPSGFIVLDFDQKKDGLGSLEDLYQFHPEIDDTWIVATPGGGYHYYFLDPNDDSIDNNSPMPGLDIRYDGTYVVAPPSIHPNGGKYKWLKKAGSKPAALPAGILARIKEARKASDTQLANFDEGIVFTEGNRYNPMFRRACSLRAKGLDVESLSTVLRAENAKHCAPPLADDKIEAILKSACKYAPGEVWAKFIDYDRRREAKRLAHEQGHPDPNKGKKKLVLTKYDAIKEEQVEWLMPGYLAFGKFNLLWGMEGRGKSYGTLGIISALTRGEPLPGSTALEAKPGSALIFTYEDDPNDTIKPRLRMCGADMARVYTVHYNDGVFTWKDVEAFRLAVTEIPDLRLVVIDPLTGFTAGLSDNDESQVREAMQPIVRIAMQRKFALVGVKHANKDDNKSLSDRVAGTRAWTALARSTVLCGHDNEKENAQFHTYGGMLPTKGNLAGTYPPYGYEIDNGVFRWTGVDRTLTPERLFPKKKEKDKAA